MRDGGVFLPANHPCPPPSLETRAEALPATNPPPSLETRAEGFFSVTHSLCLPLTPSVARNASGGVYPYFLPPTSSVARNAGGGVFLCHPHSLPATNLPPSPETRAEGSFLVTHTPCLPPTSSVARNASGGVYLYSLPATNPLRCSKRGRRGLYLSPTLSACHEPPPSLETRAEGLFLSPTLCLPSWRGHFLCHPHSLPATNPLRRSKRGRRVFFVTHSLPAINPLRCSKRERRGLPILSACH